MKKQISKVNFSGYMKIVDTHIECDDRPSPGRKEDGSEESCYEQDIFSFKQKCRNYKIIDDIIVGRDENQIAEFDRHRFCKTDRIRPEYDYPEAVYDHPEQNMGKPGSYRQIIFLQK
jgi:hypothetical protein